MRLLVACLALTAVLAVHPASAKPASAPAPVQAPTPVQAPAAEQEAQVIAERAAVRAGPGTGHKTIRHAKRGERLAVESVEGAWVRLRGSAWVALKDVRLSAAAALAEREDRFLDWAVSRGEIVELTVRDRGTIWVVMSPASYKSDSQIKAVAQDLACGYRRITGLAGPAVVTIWPETGVGERWAARETCK